MRTAVLWLAILLFPVFSPAQNASGNAGTGSAVITAAREILASRQKNMIAVAGEMPEGKYDFRPTPQQITFGHLVEHMAKSNYFICSKLATMPAAPAPATEKDGKTKLVNALQNSFDYCGQAIGKLTASGLTDQVEMFGGKKMTKVGALFDLTNDWADHYSAAAIYLRLNGLLPPTAKGKE